MENNSLTPAQIDSFHTDGYLTGIQVMETAAADRVRDQFDRLEAREGRDNTRIGLLDRHFTEPFLRDLALNSRILDAMEALLGPDILLLATHVFCKYGREDKFVAWHQDVTYWGLEPPVAVTAWYAVDDADQENGCMRVIPGTHLPGIRQHGKSDRKGNLLSINQEASVSPEEEARAVDLPLRAGQISLHHGALVHGSLPNRSDRRRCGVTLRYTPASVRPAAGNSLQKPWHAVPVRGRDRWQHFPPPPEGWIAPAE